MSYYFLICHTYQQNCSNNGKLAADRLLLSAMDFEHRSQFVLFCCRICCFYAENFVCCSALVWFLCKLCWYYANCADIMQIVLFLCKLWGFYSNSAVLMQIVLFWCKLWHLSQFTLFCRKWHFSREIRALAGTFGSAIRRWLLLMMSDYMVRISLQIKEVPALVRTIRVG